MRKFTPVIGISRGLMTGIRDQRPMRNIIAARYIRYDLHRFTPVLLRQPFKKAFRGFGVATGPQNYISHFTTLSNVAPERMKLIST